MTERKGIYIKPDYLSIVFDNLTGIDVIQNILEMPMMVFYQKDGYVEHKRYTKVYQFDHIRIYFHPPKTVENPNQIGAYLVITGQGCDFLVAYLQQLGKDFRTFLERCRFLCGLNYFRITRLDVAIDDKNEPPYFTPKQVKRKCKRGEFISRSQTCSYVESQSETEYTGQTVYIGAEKSDIRYRFYDKDREQMVKYKIPKEEMESWKRTEIQLRNEMAQGFCEYLMDHTIGLGKLAIAFLDQHLRFVVADKNQQNKSRWETCRFWSKFLGATEFIDFNINHQENSLSDTERWLERGGGLSAYKALEFLKVNEALGNLRDIEHVKQEMRYSPELAGKIATHLCQIGRSDLVREVYRNTKKIELSHENECSHQNSNLDN